MTIPDFVVIGTSKAGTTALHEFLRQHPQISLPLVKETCFSLNDEAGLHLDSPLGDLAPPITRFEQYLVLFEEKPAGEFFGEVTPLYLEHPHIAASNIFRYNPQAHIVAILRDPSDKIYSWFNFVLQGKKKKPDFSEVVRRSIKKEALDTDWPWWSLDLAKYAANLEVFYNTFPASQLHIFKYEDFNTSPETILDHLCKQIGAMPYHFNTDQRFNLTGNLRSRTANKFIANFANIFQVRRLLPVSTYQYLRSKYEKMMQKTIPPMLAADRKMLVEYYRDDILSTQALTGLDLSDWLRT